MARPTTWFTPLDRAPFVAEHHDPAGPPTKLRVLEISSRSAEMFGRSLSAMNLRAPGREGDRGVSVESVYQAAKCYGAGGPAERPSPNGYEAKRIDRQRRAAGSLRGFQHKATFWPAVSGSAFYDRLWIKAVVTIHADRIEDLKSYDAYSDQFHRPGRSVACQARSAAMLVGLDRARQLDRIDQPAQWADTLGLQGHARPREANASDMHDTERRRTTEPAGDNKAPTPTIEARVLVCGSRNFNDYGLLAAKLDEVRDRLGDIPMRVVSGAARGADSLAAKWAHRQGVPCDEYPADWDRYGKSAGYRRNEQMLTQGDPHLVVAFPQGESRGTRQMMDIASKARVAVEEVDCQSRSTLTDTGALYDIAAIAKRAHVSGRAAGSVAAPGISEIAKLPNGDPHTDGEARVVVGGRKAGADARLVHAKLDEVLARAHPAAVRIAVEMQPGRDDLSTVASAWARQRGVHCDQYRTDDPAEGKTIGRRMVAEQKPHVVVAFPRGEQSVERLTAAAARAGVPTETVDAKGINRTATGELTDLSEARRSRKRAEPNPGCVIPVEGQSAKQNARRLGQLARDAEWATPNHEGDGRRRTLNLRDRTAFDAVRSGAAVRIDRKTDWGNPFPLRRDTGPAERREVIEQYREYLADAIDSGKVDPGRLARLDGKALACHCAPQPCHGDVLSQAASWTAGIERKREQEQERSQAAEAQPEEQLRPGANTHVFDSGDEDWDNTRAASQEETRIERPPLDKPQHPDDVAADRLERYREKIAEAGATERQLEALGADIASLRGSAERSRIEQHLRPDAGRTDPAPGSIRKALEEQREKREAQKKAELSNLISGPNPMNADDVEEIAKVLGPSVGATLSSAGTAPVDKSKPQRAAGQPPEPPPPPAPAPPPADEPTREVRVLVTGSWRHDEPADVYRKLDEVRQRIDGAPMRIATGDGRGAHHSAAAWAAEAGVPCDVYPTDWDAVGDEAGESPSRMRDERMFHESNPHAVVAFTKPGDGGGKVIMTMAEDRDVPVEHVDHTGRTVTPEDERADLRAIGRRTSDPQPEGPEQPPGNLGDFEARMEAISRAHDEQPAATR